MKSRHFWPLLLFVFILGGCMAPPKPTIDVAEEDPASQGVQLLSNDLMVGYYRSLLPHVASPARGLVYSHMTGRQPGNRFDLDEHELSLMRASMRYFDPADVYLRAGQYLSRPFVIELLRSPDSVEQLGRWLDEDETWADRILNPLPGETVNLDGAQWDGADVTFLAYVLEQNYVVPNEEGELELEGVSIGLALNPFQNRILENGMTERAEMSRSEILAEGRRIADRLLGYLREIEGLETTPIMMGLYILEQNTSVVPGSMAAKTLVAAGSSQIGSWEDVQEASYLLPHVAADYDTTISEEFSHFDSVIQENYPHNYSVVGTVQLLGGEVSRVEITIFTEFYDLAEKLSMHQLAGQLVGDTFSAQYDVTVIIRSSRDQIYGVISRPPHGDVLVTPINW